MSDATGAPSSYLTVAQTAHNLNCSPDTVRRMISRGELRALRFGRLIRIAVSDLQRAGRPVTSPARSLGHAAPAPAEIAQSGRLSNESWGQWSKRRGQAS